MALRISRNSISSGVQKTYLRRFTDAQVMAKALECPPGEARIVALFTNSASV
jgi:hypothetical protein